MEITVKEIILIVIAVVVGLILIAAATGIGDMVVAGIKAVITDLLSEAGIAL